MNYREHIESSAGVMLGKPVIKGTRITVELILKKLSEGASHDAILSAYPGLSADSINAALHCQ